MMNRIIPVLPFVISSLVVSSLLRAPRLLEFYDRAGATSHPITNMTLNSTASTFVRPPLNTLILDARKGFIRKKDGGRNQTVIGNPQFLLDFAIIGFPKCGTSTLSALLGAHPEAAIKKMEMQALSYSEPATAIWNLYSRLPSGDYKRGYKSPFDVTNKGGAMVYLRDLFPHTKLVVGVRHPILWFESFYNFRLQRGVCMPGPNGLFRKQVHGFGVQAANFHVVLAKLGKTSVNATLSLQQQQQQQQQQPKYLPRQFRNVSTTIMSPPLPNPIFFYDIEQLADTNTTRSIQFRHDLQTYLGLQQAFPPLPRANQGKVIPSATYNRDYIDICDDKYTRLRAKLLGISQQASTWIQTYFLDVVHVSSRDYLEEVLLKWMVDPCIERRAAAKRNGQNAQQEEE